MRSPKPHVAQSAPLRPLLAKEVREILSGRSLWTMLLLLCPLIGYSFLQAVSLYSESSSAALQSPVLANSLSPLDGILVPTLGSFYVAVTLLFPFVAIRVLGQEKESGALRLLVQLPYRSSTLVVMGRCAGTICGVDRRKRSNCRYHRAGGHHRVVGSRFHSRRPAGLAGMDRQAVADPDPAPFRAGAPVGRAGAGYRRRDRRIHCTCERMVAAGHSTL